MKTRKPKNSPPSSKSNHSTNAPKNGPSTEQLDALAQLVSEWDSAVQELSPLNDRYLETLISQADSGNKVATRALIGFATQAALWLYKQVRNGNPIILDLAKTLNQWAVVTFDYEQHPFAPKTLGTGGFNTIYRRVNRKPSVTKSIAIRLHTIIEQCTYIGSFRPELIRAMENLDLLYETLGESFPAESYLRIGHSLTQQSSSIAQMEDSLTNDLTHLLQMGPCSTKADFLQQFIAECGYLHNTWTKESIKSRWRLAQRLFLHVTNDHPEDCPVLHHVALAKRQAYERRHSKGALGAISTQRAGIIAEIGKVFLAFYQHAPSTVPNGEDCCCRYFSILRTKCTCGGRPPQ